LGGKRRKYEIKKTTPGKEYHEEDIGEERRKSKAESIETSITMDAAKPQK